MNRLILTTILIITLSTITYAEVSSLPKYKLSQHDYDTLSRLTEDKEVELRLVLKGDDIQRFEEELQKMGVIIVAKERDNLTIRTSVGKLNKIASFDEIILIEKEGKEKVVKRARALSTPTSPIIIQANVVCDNPPQNYQSQFQDIGAKIINIKDNIITVEVEGYGILNKVSQLNYVMRVDEINEVSAFEIDSKVKEEEKWILNLPDDEIVEVRLISVDRELINLLEREPDVEIIKEDVEIIKEDEKEIVIKCKVKKLKELARLKEMVGAICPR